MNWLVRVYWNLISSAKAKFRQMNKSKSKIQERILKQWKSNRKLEKTNIKNYDGAR